MVYKAIVTGIVREAGFYSPHVKTDTFGFAAFPEELSDELRIGSEVTVFSDAELKYGGFNALVIATSTKKLCDHESSIKELLER